MGCRGIPGLGFLKPREMKKIAGDMYSLVFRKPLFLEAAKP